MKKPACFNHVIKYNCFLFVRKAGFYWQLYTVNPQQEHEFKNLWSESFQMVLKNKKKGSCSEINFNRFDNNSKYDLANMKTIQQNTNTGGGSVWLILNVSMYFLLWCAILKTNANKTYLEASRLVLNISSMLETVAAKQAKCSAVLFKYYIVIFNGIN